MSNILTPEVFASIIDFTLLTPTTTRADVRKLCEEAKEISAGSVCVHPGRILEVASYLSELKFHPKVSAVVDFPFGLSFTYTKVEQAHRLLENGADELDMVANTGFLKEGATKKYQDDICAVAQEVKSQGGLLKVIIETCYLTREEKITAAQAVANVGRELQIPIFVKTSTGYGTPKEGPKGATVEDILLIREAVGPYSAENPIGIKASGGISDAETALKMIYAAGLLGPDGTPYTPARDLVRIGATSGKKIYEEFSQKWRAAREELVH